MNYNGWERDYLENKQAYDKLFEEACLAGEQDVSTSFLEEEIAAIANKKYAVTCASATDGLIFALQAYNIGPRDDVLVSDFSWISSASCVSAVGANPIFVDIDRNTFEPCLHSIKTMVTENTCAIVYPTLFGRMSPNIHEVVKWCKDNNIIFIEDSAQSLGVELNGVKAGSIGDISVYSFNDNKVIAGFNGGGAVMTNQKDIQKVVTRLAYHGRGTSSSDRNVTMLGRNSKMYLMNAKVISMRLKSMAKWQKRRNEIAEQYNQFFKTKKEITIPEHYENLNHNYHKYVILFDQPKHRDAVGGNIHYRDPISHNSFYAKTLSKHTTHNAKEISDKIMSLPCHAWMTNDEVEEICDKIDHALWSSYI